MNQRKQDKRNKSDQIRPNQTKSSQVKQGETLFFFFLSLYFCVFSCLFSCPSFVHPPLPYFNLFIDFNIYFSYFFYFFFVMVF
ncbi:hypothetical protein F4703DRAFT_1869584 [Phycomyces blakesleeanus]